MRLTESELRRLIVEELEDLQELDIIDESYLDEGLKETALATIAAFLMSAYGINDAEAKKLSNKVPSHKAQTIAQKIQKGSNQEAKAELVDSGIDVNKLAPATQDISLKDRPKIIPGFNTDFSDFDDIQKQQKLQQTAEKLANFAKTLIKYPSIAKQLGSRSISNVIEKMPLSKELIKTAIDKELIKLKDLEVKGITPEEAGLTAVRENKITKSFLLQLIKEEIESLDEVDMPPPAYVQKAPAPEKAPFGATVQTPEKQSVTPEEALKYGYILNGIFEAYNPKIFDDIGRYLEDLLIKHTGDQAFMTSSSAAEFKDKIIENPKIINALQEFRSKYPKIYAQYEKIATERIEKSSKRRPPPFNVFKPSTWE